MESFVSLFGLPFLLVLLLLMAAVVLSAYVKIITILSIVRVGLGADSLPHALVCGGLAFVLTFFVMFPTLEASLQALEPSPGSPALSTLSTKEQVLALDRAMSTWKVFVRKHAKPEEQQRFLEVAKKLNGQTTASANNLQVAETETATSAPVASLQDSWQVLAPAFMVSELTSAVRTGLILLLPLFILDLLVGQILLLLGANHLNTQLVALPFKLALFVFADGWSLISLNLVGAYS